MLSQFHLLRPLWLLALLPLAYIAWMKLVRGNPLNALSRQIAPHLLKHLLMESERRRRFNPTVMLLLLGVIMTLALAGPSWRQESSPFAAEQAALMVVMKITPSMEATDLLPSRLERGRHKLHDLLALRSDAPTGLIAYAGSAHLVVPATTDGRVVEQMAAALTPEVMPTEGDALAEALELAASQLRAQQLNGSVLLVTDGVSPAQLEKLAQQGAPLPLQILAAVANDESAAQNGISRAARLLKARLSLLSADADDVRRINARALSESASIGGDTLRWRDDGYLLLPMILMLLLLWGIRGWSMAWE
jgi:Ca-activated chloride channel family protein